MAAQFSATRLKQVPLRLILIVPLVLQSFAVIGLTGWFSLRNGEAAIKELAVRLGGEISHHIHIKLTQYLRLPHQINQLNYKAARLGELNLQNPEQLQQYFWSQLQTFGSISEIYFGQEQGGYLLVGRQDNNGFIIEATDNFVQGDYKTYRATAQGQRGELLGVVPDYDPRVRPWYRAAVQSKQAAWSQVFPLFEEENLGIAATQPIYDAQGQLQGVLATGLVLSQISDFLDTLNHSASGEIFIIEENGLIVASSADPHPFLLTSPVTSTDSDLTRLPASASQSPLIQASAKILFQHYPDLRAIADAQSIEFELHQQREFLHITPLQDAHGLNWFIVVVIPQSEFTAQIRANAQYTMILAGVGLAIALGLGFLTINHITWRIRRMANVIEADLRASEEKFVKVFRVSPDPMTIRVFPDGKYLDVNDRFLEVFGYTQPEVIGQTMADLTPPDSLEKLALVNQCLCQGEVVRDLEVDYCTKTGEIKTMLLSAETIQMDGQLCTLTITKDITHRKQAENELRSQAQQEQALNRELEYLVRERTTQLELALSYESTLKRITDKVRDSLDEGQVLESAVQELALNLDVYFCDAGLYSLEDQAVTICYEHLNSGRDPAIGTVIPFNSFPEVFHQLLQGEESQFGIASDQLQQPFNFNESLTVLACPLMDDQGVLGDLWLTKPAQHCFSDLEVRLVRQVANQCAIALRQVHLYQAAQQQVQELERLNHLKDDFLSTVSHELRTPMTNIKMAIQMLDMALEQSGFNVENHSRASKYMQILREECKREIELINDLLDLSRLEASQEPLNLTLLNLQEWLPGIVAPFLSRFQTQQQQFELSLAFDLPPLTTEVSTLERILCELLNNACKYTGAGETIELSCHVETLVLEAAGGITQSSACTIPLPCLILTVSNTGIEIPSQELPYIFDRFYRVPHHDPWKYGGTGLGLALVKKLTERLGGDIQVESSHQQVCFTIRYPITGVEASNWVGGQAP